MEEGIREYSGRKFSAEDISLIITTTQLYPRLSQREMASTVCELIGWVTPNGKPKRRQCVEYLRQLEEEGLIKLPAVRTKKVESKKESQEVSPTQSALESTEKREITECGKIKLEIARPGKTLARWREYVSTYHKLGDPTVRGSQIRYIITSEGQDLGCLLFSASSWALAPREEWIGWTSADKKSRLHLIVNNSRFLVLPTVRIRNFGSRVLSIAARQIQKDWLEEYCYAPVLLETFVEPPYKGTSYKASNWIYLGDTQGRGRNDRYNEWALTRKAIYVLPLQRDFRDILMGKKPCKAVNPDDF
jgi:hypothetical protein